MDILELREREAPILKIYNGECFGRLYSLDAMAHRKRT